MSSENFLNPHKITSAGDMSADVTSPGVDARYLDDMVFQCNFTGSPTGTFSVQGSVDNSTWTALALTTSPAASGSASTVLIDVNQTACPYVRCVYTFTSGTGSLDIWVSGKGL